MLFAVKLVGGFVFIGGVLGQGHVWAGACLGKRMGGQGSVWAGECLGRRMFGQENVWAGEWAGRRMLERGFL